MRSRDLDLHPDEPTAERPRSLLLAPLIVLLSLAALLGLLVASSAEGAVGTETARGTTRLLYAPGKIVPIPASIPHEEGDMVDRRILRDLRWLASKFPLYVTDGYSGPLPGGGHAGCHGCHVKGSDHYNGLAVDIVPLFGTARCDARWRGITRLARWAEPRQNRPVPPFRWVGYDGDAGHGCGHHLHLSWNHAAANPFGLAEWVEALPATLTASAARKPRGKKGGAKAEDGKNGAAQDEDDKRTEGETQGPTGGAGVSRTPTGGISARPRGSGD
ncbi:MAG: hypothetical protein R2725_02160 [Solirubrobacterales bacterium]